MKNILLFLFIFCSLFSFSQSTQEIKWQKCLGGTNQDQAYSIWQTADGGYVVAGCSFSNDGDVTGNHGGYDYWVVKLNSANAVQWQKSLGGTGWDNAYSIQQTADGGYVVAGSSKSNDGDVTGNHSLEEDAWVVKLDTAGAIQWQKCLGGTGDDEAYSIQQTADGGYVVAGYSDSNNGDVTGNHGYTDYWVVKLDAAGTIQWQKCLGGTYIDKASSIQQTVDGGYVVAGMSFSNDGDVTGNHGGWFDYWVVKLDAAGTIQWQKCLGGTSDDQANSIQQTADGGYVVAGTSKSSDGNVTGHHGSYDYWVVKLDAAGTIQWQKCLGGTSDDEASSIQQTVDGGYVVAGTSKSSDGHVTGNHGQSDYWVVKLDATGILQWQKSLGGTGIDYANSIQQTTGGGYLVAGKSESNDGDVTGNHGLYDYWLVKLTGNYNLITGKLFIDANSNSMQDAGEPYVINKQVSEVNTGRFGFSQNMGVYYVSVLNAGNFSVVPASINYYNAVPAAHSVYFPGIHQTDSLNDFAFQPAIMVDNYCITITPTTAFRPGFNAGYLIGYENTGTTSASPTIVFYPDSALTFVSASPVASSVAVDSVVWNLNPLAPFQTGSIMVTVNVNAGTPVGTPIHSEVRIEPAIINPAGCNFDYWVILTTGSVDPNDILVDEDSLLTTQFPNPPYLEYIIRFQNTGNDTAFNVKVSDPIDTSKLEISTLELVASSHSVTLDYNYFISEMEFRYDNILLPDSNVNKPGSHGFVRYRIKPKTTLIVGDSIVNNAAIYFDFNSAVLTNNAISEIVLPVSAPDSEHSAFHVEIFPNPFTTSATITINQSGNFDFMLYNLFGQQVRRAENISDQYTLERGTLPAGVYFYEVEEDGRMIGSGKVVIQ